MDEQKQTTRNPTPKQIRAAELITENVGKDKPAPMGEVLRQAGYSDSTADTPSTIIDSPTMQDLLAQYIPDADLAKTHQRLLKMRKLDHMVFPLWKDPDEEIPEEGDLPGEYLEAQPNGGSLKRYKKVTEGSSLSDEDIVDLLDEVNCIVRKIVHGETARHVYFWADDANAQKGALELAYKIKGLLNSKPEAPGTINFIKTANFNSKSYVSEAE